MAWIWIRYHFDAIWPCVYNPQFPYIKKIFALLQV